MAAEDPRDRLRRYLEQRRELGETELVLDTLDVNDVLRLLGAGQEGGQAGPARSERAQEPGQPKAEQPIRPREQPSGPTRRAESASPAGDPSAFGDDWRAALRAAGSAPPGEVRAKAPSAPSQSRDEPAPAREAMPPRTAAPAEPPAPDRAPAPSLGGDFVPGLAADGSVATPEPIARAASLDDIAQMAKTCTRCPLYQTALNAVPGEGHPQADLMIVGEAPGATEDETGRPFVGAAGQLLTKIISAINLEREDVFIANVLKHRPPGNRNPKPEEVTACSPYLLRQIELVRPKVILALGTFAAQTLLETNLTIGKLRGQVHQYHGVPLIVTYHPAALLRNPAWKRPTWEDVQLARRVLDRASGA